jgi:hypothetical protein
MQNHNNQMKSMKILLAAMVVLSTLSFTENPIVKDVAGTYGICDCDGTTSSKIELTISPDYTFHYVDNDNLAKKVDITGKWTLDGSTIRLKDFETPFAIHEKWNLDKNDKCLKSRRGMEWRRLCLIQPCK